MLSNSCIPEAAIERVDAEQSVLQRETQSFESFREAVRLASPASASVESSETARTLRAAYEPEVMAPTEYRATFGDSLGDSLHEELGPSVATMLRSEQPITPKRKRTLLVTTTDAIERRQVFLERLASEREALSEFNAELRSILASVEDLPACSTTGLSFEARRRTWERYTDLERQCEQLIDRRQHQLIDREHRIRMRDTTHGFSEYIYADLPSRYPVLSAIATVATRIKTDSAEHAPPALTD